MQFRSLAHNIRVGAIRARSLLWARHNPLDANTATSRSRTMKEKDEINVLRQRMAREAAAGNFDDVAAIQETIADMEADTEDDDSYGEEE